MCKAVGHHTVMYYNRQIIAGIVYQRIVFTHIRFSLQQADSLVVASNHMINKSGIYRMTTLYRIQHMSMHVISMVWKRVG